jgi:hypothetical protein
MEVNTSSTVDATNIYDYINGFLMTPSAFVIVLIVLIGYVLFFAGLGKSTDTNTTMPTMSGDSTTTKTVIAILVVMFIVLFLANSFQYFFGVDIVASIKNIFLGEPIIDIKVLDDTTDGSSSFNGSDGIKPSPLIPEIKARKQVYNIPGNEHTYKDAEAVCTAFGSRLASYSEIEDAYNGGGEWCNYGWSKGQMALFPTQKSTFDNLQKIEGHENDCGRPGVNGGYMANPRLKFGVNCYGYKPKMDTEEEEMMQNTSPYPKTQKDILMEKRVDYWKQNLDSILVSPFNYNSWSRI